MNTTTKIIKTYRYANDPAIKNIEAAIARLLEHMQVATGHLPSVIIVPTIEVAEGQRVIGQVIKRFAKAGITVEITVKPVGGCLIGEVWWEEERDG
jgi:NAD/NADP transhydrogenase beta subunit